MIIVNRDEFLSLPENTLFSKYEPYYFGPLSIKGETIGNDFYEQRIHDAVDCDNSTEFVDKLTESTESGASFDMDFNIESRDGMFEDDQLFVVWEKKDVEMLVSRLQETLK